MSYLEHKDALTQMALELAETKDDLENKYLKPFLGNQFSNPDDFKLDVKSYCVLLHAAIEDFIEGVALSVYKASCDLFLEEGIISIPFMYSLHLSGALDKRVSEISEDDVSSGKGEGLYPVTPVEYFLNNNFISDSTISSMLEGNHGMSRKYLKKIMMILGIHIDFKSVIYSDWKLIAEYRGEYAHSNISYIDRTKAKKPLSPEKCSQIGNSVIDFSYLLVEWAEQSLSRDYKENIKNIQDVNAKKKKESLKREELEEEKNKEEKRRNQERQEKNAIEKEENKIKNIERAKKLDILLKWAEEKHPDTYKEIFGDPN
ncbi:HEPN domain-containing protein [Pantoea eucalypti]|uniref:HEPN domain-containing protein n=1 Tax=Pantoea eucalypti TaxID=470933 RepID=UPI00301D7F64